ncbi:GIY-YIG nuclease family protein [Novosphingobium huizhouense]|uniref:GIY-YIG nuclease family protein n=1 Tax=Novosphingobium huizhouense TaxID=2866625 RepID=UPI001CD81E9B|nr:GIY-YIG nuclease family protein [Novosphingobium huizhouense]
MHGPDRKAASAAYRQRKVEAGIYAIRCSATGEVWTGTAPDVATIRNRVWFTLRQGANPHRSLQDAWTRHGEAAFTLEIVDSFDCEDETPASRTRKLRDGLNAWAQRLGSIKV